MKNTTSAKRTTKSSPVPATPASSKLDCLLTELGRASGATIDELAAATGWQKHSARGAMSGSLKRKGHSITSEKMDGIRRYRLEPSA